MLIVGYSGEKMGTRHRDLYGFTGISRYLLELIDETQVYRICYRSPANSDRMGDVRVVLRDRLWSGLTLQRRYSLPEVIKHGIGGRMPIMGSAVCLPTRDYVDTRCLLLEDCCLHHPVLCIRHVLREQLPHCDQPVERFIPARDTVSSDHRRRIFRVVRHLCPQRLTENELNDFSWLWHDGCGK